MAARQWLHPDAPQVFCGNFEYDAPAKDIERLFDKYGPVEKIDLKTGEQQPTDHTHARLPSLPPVHLHNAQPPTYGNAF